MNEPSLQPLEPSLNQVTENKFTSVLNVVVRITTEFVPHVCTGQWGFTMDKKLMTTQQRGRGELFFFFSLPGLMKEFQEWEWLNGEASE